MSTRFISLNDGRSPQVHESCFIAPGAQIIGEVEIKEASSVWFNTVIRGDVNYVKIGSQTNVQDASVLHVTHNTHPLIVGDQVTIGHQVLLHGCTIKDRVLIGMGSIIMDGAIVESDVIIGAGSLVSQGTVIPSGYLAYGRPAKPIRPLRSAEISFLPESARHYIKTQEMYA